MLILELYKTILINCINLDSITNFEDFILCSGVCVCYLIDCLLWFVVISIIVKICTKKTIFYWAHKILKI